MYLVLFSFHLPLFFFASGIFLKEDQSWTEFVRQKADALLKPYAALILFLFLFAADMPKLSAQAYFQGVLIGTGETITEVATIAWIALWFLPHMFLSLICAYLVLRVTAGLHPKRSIRLVVAVVLIVSGAVLLGASWFSSTQGKPLLSHLAFSADITPATTGFVLLGFCFSGQIRSMSFSGGRFLFALLLFSVLHTFSRNTIDFNLRMFGNIPIALSQALLGIYLTFSIASLINRYARIGAFLAYTGYASVLILMFHRYINFALGNAIPHSANPHLDNLLYTVAGVALPMALMVALDLLRPWSHTLLPMARMQHPASVGIGHWLDVISRPNGYSSSRTDTAIRPHARASYANAAPEYRVDIDGLRCLAVIAVVLYHAFPRPFRGGFVGVDIFFVISGYLISTIILRSLSRGEFSFGEFYLHRVRRIFPALITVLATTYVLGWFLLLPQDFMRLGKHMAGSGLFFQNFFLWLEADYFDVSSKIKPLLHLWSLAVEEQFYLAYPLIIWLIWRRQLRLGAFLVAALLLSLAVNVIETRHDIVGAYYFPHTRLWELLAGGLLAHIYLQQSTNITAWRTGTFIQRLRRVFSPNVISIIGFILLLASFFAIRASYRFPGWWAIAPVIGTVMLIGAGPTAVINKNFLSSKPMVRIGLISYPLYLWHWPLLSFANILNGRENPSSVVRWALIFAAALLALVTYRHIEKPVRLRFDQNPLKSCVLMLGAMTVLCMIGGATWYLKGLTIRFASPPELTQPIDFKWFNYVRNGTCHLHDVELLNFSQECFETARPAVTLWGDSHAGSLYPGLRKLQQHHQFGLTQLTNSGCPPFLGAHTYRENCNELNRLALERLVVATPDVLLIVSAFDIPEFGWKSGEMQEKFSATLDYVRQKLPDTRIVVVGPVPHWEGSPQKATYESWKTSGNKWAPIPTRVKTVTQNQLDAALRSISSEHGVTYISAIDKLCNEKGCVSKVGDAPEDFIATDYGHLSKSGAEYFAGLIEGDILSMK